MVSISASLFAYGSDAPRSDALPDRGTTNHPRARQFV